MVDTNSIGYQMSREFYTPVAAFVLARLLLAAQPLGIFLFFGLMLLDFIHVREKVSILRSRNHAVDTLLAISGELRVDAHRALDLVLPELRHRDAVERHRRDHPHALELERHEIVELVVIESFGLVVRVAVLLGRGLQADPARSRPSPTECS